MKHKKHRTEPGMQAAASQEQRKRAPIIRVLPGVNHTRSGIVRVSLTLWARLRARGPQLHLNGAGVLIKIAAPRIPRLVGEEMTA